MVFFQAEEAEREERKKLESIREEERRKEEERIRLEEERQVGLVVFIDGNFEPSLSLRLLLCKVCDQQNSLWLSIAYIFNLAFCCSVLFELQSYSVISTVDPSFVTLSAWQK